jgi:ParB/RepB/Spo0J family partition protein
MAERLEYVRLERIRTNPVALRDVDKESEDYKGLVDSIRNNGVFNPIVLREVENPNGDGQSLYALVDGLQRFTASKDAGLEVIPAHVKDVGEGDIIEAQIMANVHKIETKPVEYAKALQRLLSNNPALTMTELSSRLSKGPSWLNARLGLVKLGEKIQPLVNDGKITLTNAIALSKAPKEMQDDFVQRAMTMSPSEFIPTIQKAAKEYRDARRQGRDPNKEFTPVPFLQRIADIKEERQKGTIAAKLIEETKITDPKQAFALALDWVLNIDPISTRAQKEKDEQRKKDQEIARVQRAKERAEEKLKEAQKAQAAVAAPTA